MSQIADPNPDLTARPPITEFLQDPDFLEIAALYRHARNRGYAPAQCLRSTLRHWEAEHEGLPDPASEAHQAKEVLAEALGIAPAKRGAHSLVDLAKWAAELVTEYRLLREARIRQADEALVAGERLRRMAAREA